MEKDEGSPQNLAPPYPKPPLNNSGGPAAYAQPGSQAPSYTTLQPGPHLGGSATGVYAHAPQYFTVQAGPHQVVTHLNMVPRLTDFPGRIECPHCQKSVVTEIKHIPGVLTWTVCLSLIAVPCFSWIPFCINACKDVEHRCPDCKNCIYIYKRA